MKKLFSKISLFFVVVSCGTVISCSDVNEITPIEDSQRSKAQNLAAPAAPGGGKLTFINNSPCVVTVSSLHAQTTFGPGATTTVHHKAANLVVINPGMTIEYKNYVTTTPTGYALPWWMVNTASSSTQVVSSLVQSTYGEPFWSGAHITAKYMGTDLSQTSSSDGFRNTVGAVSQGDFNTYITFGTGSGSCTATWSYNSLTQDSFITITN